MYRLAWDTKIAWRPLYFKCDVLTEHKYYLLMLAVQYQMA